MRRLNIYFALKNLSSLQSIPISRSMIFCYLVLTLIIGIGASRNQNVYAQSSTASLSGNVVDEGKLPIVGAEVRITRLDTQQTIATQTNSSGLFVFQSLTPSRYTLSIQRQGFAEIKIENIILNVADRIKVPTIEMRVGDVKDSVTVTDTSLIREDASVGTVVDRNFVGNLPLSGRNYNSLLTLTPGVAITNASTSPGQYSFNGQRSDANNYMVDGVSANFGISPAQDTNLSAGGTQAGVSVLGGLSNLISIDALQEFKVLTSTYAPEYGRTPGGQISLVTRSGNNNYHGAMFNYLRNDLFDANDWFANRDGQAKPPLRQNNFGGVLGGPILLPKRLFGPIGYRGTDRTFFFFSYEGFRLRQPRFITNALVPSINLRQNAPAPLQQYLKAFPLPNGPQVIDELSLLSVGFSDPTRLDTTGIRIDHTINNRHAIFGRYNDSPSETKSRNRGTLSSQETTILNSRTTTVGLLSTFSSTIQNDIRFNYSTARGRWIQALDNFGGAIPLSPEQLFPSFSDPHVSLFSFALQYSGYRGLVSGVHADNKQRQLNIVDTLSITLGAHQLKFGMDYRRLSPVLFLPNYFLGYNFNDLTSLQDSKISMLLTAAGRTSHPLYTNLSAFAQDTIRLGQRTTMTYGVRWELNPPPRTTDGIDPLTLVGVDNLETAKVARQGAPLFKTTFKNFAPRFGVSYQISGKQGFETIIRGGIGIFYDLGSTEASYGFTTSPFSTGLNFNFDKAFPPTNDEIMPPSFPNPPFPVTAFTSNLALPRTYQWNVALQQSIGNSQTLTTSYVAAIGRKLPNSSWLFGVNPSIPAIYLVDDKATSDYHALQVQYNRRLSGGLQALVGYTWSHAIDEISADAGIGLDRGSAAFDIRHSFSAAATYDIPSLKVNAVVEKLLRNWSLNLMGRFQTSAPLDIYAAKFVPLNSRLVHIRPDLILGQPIYINDLNSPGGKRLNPDAFGMPPFSDFGEPLRQGTLGRNVVRSFPLHQIDLSLNRRFNITEKLKLNFRADMFNILNHPNFGDPDSELQTPTFGLSTRMFGQGLSGSTVGAGFNSLYQIGGPRSIQFSLKLEF